MRMFWKKKYSSDEVLKIVAASLKQQVLEREEEYNNKAELIDETMHIEPDQDFLKFARGYDSRKKPHRWKKSFQTIAMVLVCVLITGGIALESSEAFRAKVYSLFFDDEDGGVSLFTEEESKMLIGWEEYWFPAYVPEGLQLVNAGIIDVERVLHFKSEDGSTQVRIIEIPLDVAINMDTDTNQMEEVSIGYHKGYLFEDERNSAITLLLLMDEQQVEISAEGQIDKKTVLKIAERLEYVKE